MSFLFRFFLIFCIGLCLERRDYQRRAKNWKNGSANGINLRNPPSEGDVNRDGKVGE